MHPQIQIPNAFPEKTPKTVHLEIFLGPSYFEAALVYVFLPVRVLEICPVVFATIKWVKVCLNSQ